MLALPRSSSLVGLIVFSIASYCDRLFHFHFIYVGLDFNYVLAIFFSVNTYIVLAAVELVFISRRERSCLVRDCSVLTHFILGVNRWWLCEPLGSTYSMLKLWIVVVMRARAGQWSSCSLSSAPCSTHSIHFLHSLHSYHRKNWLWCFLFGKVCWHIF